MTNDKNNNHDEIDMLSLDIPSELKNVSLWKRIVMSSLVYSILGLLVGVAFILSGLVLSISGISGNSHFITEMLGLKSEINDAPPGVISLILGFFTIYITRFSINIKNGN